MIKEIIILGILVIVGWWGVFYVKKDFPKEKYIFLGFIVLLFSVIYGVSILGYKIGGAVDISKDIEKARKEIYAAKNDLVGIAKDVTEISYILADGTGRWNGMPKEHLEEINKIKGELFKKLSLSQEETNEFEKNSKEKIESINRRINAVLPSPSK